MKKLLSISILLCASVLAGCEKNAVQDITGALPAARVKFFNFGVGAPAVNFYANDTKMTATFSSTGAESVNGVVYGGVGAGGFYSGIEPGAYTISGRIAGATDKDLAITTVPVTIGGDKFYSFYVSGLYNATTKTAEGFIVEDAFPAKIDYDNASVRFVNAVSNSQPMSLFATNAATGAEIAIGAAVAYKAGGTFITLPPGVYNLATRSAGSATAVVTRTNVNFENGRVYTIGARGSIGAAVVAQRPFLDNTLNR